MTTAKKIEKLLGIEGAVFRGWVLDGAGPARFGWYAHYPCKNVFLGRSFAEIKASRVAS